MSVSDAFGIGVSAAMELSTDKILLALVVATFIIMASMIVRAWGRFVLGDSVKERSKKPRRR